MTFSQLIADTKARIGSTPETGINDATLGGWINRGLHVFCSEHPFTWLQKKHTFSTQSSTETYGLPSDFAFSLELVIGSDIYTRVSHEQRKLYSSSSDIFSVFDKEIYLNPIPTSNGSSDAVLKYLRKPTSMTDDAHDPSNSDIASMPEEYHEALVLYAFAVYNTYDEEHGEKQEIMGNPRNPLPGTYYYFVDMARRASSKDKTGQRSKFISKQFFTGHAHPNQTANSTTVLGN